MDTTLARQDESLDALSSSIGRVKRVALDISAELENQAPLIEELDTRVESSTTRVKSATSRVNGLLRSIKTDRSSQVVCCLVLVIIVAILALIFTH